METSGTRGLAPGRSRTPGEDDARIGRALESLFATKPSRTVLAGPGVSRETFDCPAATSVEERELGRALKAGVDVLALAKVTPTSLRALRETPPTILVVTAEPNASTRALLDLRRTLVLGPRARLRVGRGNVVACAPTRGELDGLIRTLGGVGFKLALCPTPPWLWRALQSPALADYPVAGYVAAEHLSTAWARWARRSTAPHVLVPLGVTTPDPADADPCLLERAVAAHALERATGPVFPAPRVVALVLEGLRRGDEGAASPAVDPESMAVWIQARRALPMTGAVVGMEQPEPGMSTEAPTASFLAQRALLRARAVETFLEGALPRRPIPEEEGVRRAEEVLRSAGEVLTDQESKVVLRGFGMDVTRQAVAGSASGAAGFAERIGYPVVLKALSPDLRRRSDIGGVVLSLSTSAAVRRAYATIVDNIERRAPTARLDGVLVAEMLDDGLDLHCGGVRLPDGDVVLHGRVLDTPAPIEPALGLCPLEPIDAVMLAHAVLSRVPTPALRRQTDPDVRGLAELFLQLDTLFSRTGDRILGVDLGPVRLVGSRGYVTLDARIVQKAHLEGL